MVLSSNSCLVYRYNQNYKQLHLNWYLWQPPLLISPINYWHRFLYNWESIIRQKTRGEFIYDSQYYSFSKQNYGQWIQTCHEQWIREVTSRNKIQLAITWMPIWNFFCSYLNVCITILKTDEMSYEAEYWCLL